MIELWDWYQLHRDTIQFATIVVVTIFVGRITATVVLNTVHQYGWPWRRRAGVNGRFELDRAVAWFFLSLMTWLLASLWARWPGAPPSDHAADARTVAIVLTAVRAAKAWQAMVAERAMARSIFRHGGDTK